MLRLTALRRERGWTITETARRSRIHPSTVGKIEAKRHRPYAPELRRLAKALGVPAADAETLLEEVEHGGQD